MTEELFFDGARYISAADAAKNSKLTRDYIARLAREGRIIGKLVGRQWYVSTSSLDKFLISQEQSNEERRNALVQERLSEYGRSQQEQLRGVDAEAVGQNAPAAAPVARETIQEKLAEAVQRTGQDSASRSIRIRQPVRLEPPTLVAKKAERFNGVFAAALAIMLVAGLYSSQGAFASVLPQIAGTLKPASQVASAADAVSGTIGAIESAVSSIFSPFFGAYLAQTGQQGVVTVQVAQKSQTVQQIIEQPQQTAAATPAPTKQVETIVENPIIQKLVETQPIAVSGGVSEGELDQRLQQLTNSLTEQIALAYSANATTIAQNYNVTAQSNAIDQLNGTAITNPSISGGTISNASISGGSISGTALSNIRISGTTTLDALTLSSPLPVSSGGTGIASYTPGDVLYANASGTLTTLGIGGNGQVLKISGGLPSWGVDLTGSGGAGAWATSTNSQFIFPADSTNVVVIGNNATTTTNSILEVTGNTLLRGNATISATATASAFVATSTATSTFGGGIALTSGCLSINGTCLGSGGGSSNVSTSSQNTWGALQLFAGNASSSNFSNFGTAYFGGTATSSFNSLGQLTLANLANSILSTNGNGQVVATSSIGTNVLTGSLGTINGQSLAARGSITVTAASSSLLADSNTFSGTDTFSTTINGSVSGNAGTATALQNSRTINGIAFNGTSNIVITAASSSLLADSNLFSGNSVFSASTTFSNLINVRQASTSLETLGTLYLPNLANAILSTNASGQVVATSSIGVNNLSGVLGIGHGGTGTSTTPSANKVLLSDASGNWEYVSTSSLGIIGSGGSSASSTLLADSNTFSGNNLFSNLLVLNGGLTASASSTIGNGTQAGGLTISGGATTTGTAYFASSIGLGTTSPSGILTVDTTKMNLPGTAPLLLLYASSTQTGDLFQIESPTAPNGYFLKINQYGNMVLPGAVQAGNGNFQVSAPTTVPLQAYGVFGGSQTADLFDLSTNDVTITDAFNNKGYLGLGTSTPYGLLALSATNGSVYPGNNLFTISSSTSGATTTLFGISNTGSITTALGSGFVGSSNGKLYTFASSSISSASSTLLTDSNTFSGNNTFSSLLNLSNGFISNASSTVTNNFTVTGTANVGALSIGSLSGLLKTVSGAVVTASAGTDYQAPITASYPILFSGNALSLAFGTTTANSWSALQQFNGGLTAYASSTIGNGTQAGGLTINGGATTTGIFAFSGGVVSYPTNTTSTIPDNSPYAWTIATSTTAAPLFRIDSTSGSASIAIGSAGSDVYIGDTGSSPNLVFQNSGQTIKTAGGGTINIGAGSDLINFGGSATTTFSGNGINVTTGCVAVNGTCIGSTSASSTLLADSNTFSGNNVFTASTTFSNLINVSNASTSILSVAGHSYLGTAQATSFAINSIISCTGSEALQTDGSGNVSCGLISTGGASSGGGWTTNNLGRVSLSTSTDLVAIGATTTPYAKLSIVSGSAATTTLAIVPASGQTANILDIYNTSGNLGSVFTASGNLGLGTTSPGSILSLGGVANFTAATSTFYSSGGINLSGGCFSINGTCVGGSSASSTLLTDSNTFAGSNTFSSLLKLSNGLLATASSTIGNGTQAGGFTINGGATTTGNAYFAGKVGIGTTSPTTLLTLWQSSDPTLGNDGASNLRVYNAAGSSFGELQVDTSGVELSSSGATPLPLYLNTNRAANPTLTLATNNNVGFGSTTPSQKLSVEGNALIHGNLNTSGSVTFTGLGSGFVGSSNGQLYTFASSSVTAASSTLLADSNTFSGSNTFSSLLKLSSGLLATASSTIGNGTQAGGLTISGGATTTGNAYFAGNVGIGTTTPTDTLDVYAPVSAVLNVSNYSPGAVNPFSAIQLSNYRGNQGGGDPAFISYAANGTPSAPSTVTTGMKILSLQGRGYQNDSYWNGLASGYINMVASGNWGPGANAPSYMAFGTSFNERMRIDQNGNVGIGTSTPNSILAVQNSGVGNIFSLADNSGTQRFTISNTGNIAAAGQLQFSSIPGTSTYMALDGQSLLTASTTGENVSVGFGQLNAVTSGSQNAALGYQSLWNLTSGQDNVGIGYQAGSSITTTNNSISIGTQANNRGGGSATGNDIAIGPSALAWNAGSGENVGIGFRSLYVTTGGGNGAAYNVALGYGSLSSNNGQGLSGSNNVALGSNSMQDNYTGSNSVGVGFQALNYNDAATNTVAVGYEAANGTALYGSGYDALLGAFSGYNFSTGADYNTLLGYGAGYDLASGSNNVLIGSLVDAPSNNASNQLNIGNILYGNNLYHSATFATSSAPVLNGAIGIGTTTPWAKFSIAANNGDTKTTLFAISSSTAGATTTLFSISNTGTTTAANGFNITAGCFSLNGTCLNSISLNGANTWNALQTFSAGASTTNISASGEGYFGTASTTNLTVSSQPNAILSTNASGQVGALSVGPSLSFSGNTLALNLANSNSWSATQTFGSGLVSQASSTFVGVLNAAGGLSVGNATSTFANGITLTSGCVFYNGSCIGANAGTVNGGSAGDLAYYATNGTTVSATSSLFITPTGQVGIGTTTPGIIGGSNQYLTINSKTGAGDTSGALELAGYTNGVGTETSHISFFNQAAWSELARVSAVTSNDISQGNLVFSVGGSGGLSEAARFNPLGYLGIGTTSPGSILSINGVGNFVSGGQSTLYNGLQINGIVNFNPAQNAGDKVATFGGTSFLVASSTGYNTALGLNALSNITSGTANLAFGYQALQNATSTTDNIAIGYSALAGSNANFSGTDNIGIGYGALKSNSSGFANLGEGTFALELNTTGGQNVGLGYSTLSTNTTGNNNVAVGYQSLNNLNGSNNVGVGFQTIGNATSSSDNTALGYRALTGSTLGNFTISGTQNVAVGESALQNYITGSQNTALGFAALQNATSTFHDTAVGYNALANENRSLGGTGSTENTAIGWEALNNAGDNAVDNVAVGASAGSGLSNGAQNNIAIGYRTLYTTNTAHNNTAIGIQALTAATGGNNTVLGAYSGLNLSSGQYNTLLGINAGGSLLAGSSNIALGANVDIPNVNGDQQLNVGNVLFGTNLYNGSTLSAAPTVNGAIGIGTTTPWAKLAIQANNGDTNTTLFAIGSSTASATTTLFSISNTGVLALNPAQQKGDLVATLGGTSFVTASSTAFNTGIGLGALASITSGTGNTALGTSALNAATSSGSNTAVGFQSLLSDTTGGENSGFGWRSLWNNTTGIRNTAIGNLSLWSNTTGQLNTALGWYAAGDNITGSNNVALGYNSLGNATSTGDNTAVGTNALTGTYGGPTITGTQNVALGESALQNFITAGQSVAVGYQSLLNATSTNSNVAVGFQSLKGDSSNFSGNQSTAVGAYSLYSLSTGNSNSAFGYSALSNNTAGAANSAFGWNALAGDTTGGDNAGFGVSAMRSNITGSNNSALGAAALQNATSSSDNVAVGLNALQGSTAGSLTISGTQNVAVGESALQNFITGSQNVAVGYQALLNATSSSDNTAVGYQALNCPFAIDCSGTDNTALGSQALLHNTSGSNNVALGSAALLQNTTGINNEAIGVNALVDNTSGGSNTAIGLFTLNNNLTGWNNIGIGESAVNQNVSGFNNLGIGTGALQNASTTGDNLAIGNGALAGSTVGSLTISGTQNVAVGEDALQNYITGSQNTAVGYQSLQNATSSAYNAALGWRALQSLTTGSHNVAIGNEAMLWATSSAYNIALGEQALSGGYDCCGPTNTVSGSYNIALGTQALFANTTGTGNVAIGNSQYGNVLSSNSTGSFNIALGVGLNNNTTGNGNVAIGGNLTSNTTGSNNVAIGSAALSASNVDGNVGIGNDALYVSTTGTGDTAVGDHALANNVSATNTVAVGSGAGAGAYASGMHTQGGTFIGRSAGGSIATGGDYNTLLGYYAGSNITTGANNILLGVDNSCCTIYNNLTTGSNNIGIGTDLSFASGTASNQLNIQNILFGANNAALGTTVSSGTFGIGTTTPWARLAIQANNGDTNTTLFAIGSSTASATTTLFNVSNTGFVGIGSTSPYALLSVDASNNPSYSLAAPTVAIKEKSGQTGDLLDVFDNTGNKLAYIDTNGSIVANDRIQAQIGDLTPQGGASTILNVSGVYGGTQTADLVDLTFNSAVNIPDTVFNNHGYLGIGTSSPWGKLAISLNNGETNANAFIISSSTSGATTTLFGVSNTGSITTALGSGFVGSSNGKLYTFASSSIKAASSTLLADSNTFSGNNTFTNLLKLNSGLLALASSTIGNGTQAGGLTISGGATTTGNAYFIGSLGVGTQPNTNYAINTFTDINLSTIAALRFGGAFTLQQNSSDVTRLSTGGTGTNAIQFTLGSAEYARLNTTGFGIGTSTPWAKLSVAANNGDTNTTLFAISSSTASATTTLFSINNTGILSLNPAQNTNDKVALLGGSTFIVASSTNETTALGQTALGANLSGYGETALGYGALATATNTQRDTAIGAGALGSLYAPPGNSIYTFDTAVGSNAFDSLVWGQEDIALGTNAGHGITSGSDDIAIGFRSFYSGNMSGGNQNIGIGSFAWQNLGSGSNNNTALGYQAGGSQTAGSSNIVIGANVDDANLTGSQQLNIGDILYGTNVYNGGGGISSAPAANGTIGIGTSTPWAKLAIQANNGDTNTTLFAIGSSTASATTTLFSINNTGVLALNPAQQTGDLVATLGGTSFITASSTAFNTSLGLGALSSITSGNGNKDTAVGYNALLNATSTGSNTAVGFAALQGNATDFSGNWNTAVGQSALAGDTEGSDNVAIGQASMASNTTGSQNAAVGEFSLNSNTTGGQNDAFGEVALGNNTGGHYNSAFGNLAQEFNLTGWRNAAFGAGALQHATSTDDNTALGTGALAGSTVGSLTITGTQNVAVGENALQNYITGSQNTAIGYQSLLNATSSSFNTAIGFESLQSDSNNAAGSENVALGYQSLLRNTTGSQSVAIGNSALSSNTSGSGTAVGYDTLLQNTTGSSNAAFGWKALFSNTTGNNNVAIGDQSISSNTSGINNVGLGVRSLFENLSGSSDTAIGNWSLANATTTSDNVALGYLALEGSTAGSQTITGTQNVAVGESALQNFITASNNVALGYQALQFSTSSVSNIAIGQAALQGPSITNGSTGANNVAIGQNSLNGNTSGASNIGIGYFSLSSNSSGTGNIGIGQTALDSNTSGGRNIAIGGLQTMLFNQTGSSNIALGYSALRADVSGSDNVAVGDSAGFVTTGQNNTLLGAAAGIGLLSGNSNIIIGANVDAPASTTNAQLNIGNVLYGTNIYSSLYAQSSAPVLDGSIGIGTTTPWAKLAVQANNGDTNTTLFAISSSTASATTTLFSINNTGVLALNPATQKDDLVATLGGTAFITASTSASNLSLGYGALTSVTSGASNLALGANALAANTTGGDNVAIGNSVFQYADPTIGRSIGIGTGALEFGGGGSNVGIGYTSLRTATGYGNTALGYLAGSSVSTGSYNVLLGSFENTGGAITSGVNNIIIGHDIGLSASTSNNQLDIQNILFGTNNSTVGTGGISSGQLGIGTTTPWARLAIQANNGDTNTTLFAIGSSTVSATTTLFSINNNGIFNYGTNSTTTIPNNSAYAWTIATSSTASPLFRIDSTSGAESVAVGGSGSDVYIGDSNSSPNLIFQNSGQTIKTAGGGLLNIGAGSDIIDFGVNVGIGTTSPGTKLDIYNTSSGATADQAYFTNAASATSTASRIDFRAIDVNGLGTTTGAVTGILQQNYNGAKGDLALSTLNAGTLSEVMRLTSGGNVGVGTTSPWGTLAVQSNNLAANGTEFVVGSSTQIGFLVQGGVGSGDVNAAFGGLPTGPSNGYSQVTIRGTTGAVLDLSSALGTFGIQEQGDTYLTAGLGHGMIFGVNNATEAARFTSTGNVGFGTSTPWAKVSIHANNGDTNTTLFAIGSSTASATTTLFRVANTGSTTIQTSGNGYFGIDSSGDVRATAQSTGTSALTVTGAAANMSAPVMVINGVNLLNNTVPLLRLTTNTVNDIFDLVPDGNNNLMHLNTSPSGWGFDVQVQGNSALTVASTKNVGIGTTTPWAKLAIQANNGDTATTLFAIGSSTASATTTLFSVSNTGNVGIGITGSPYSLHVLTATTSANATPTDVAALEIKASSGSIPVGAGPSLLFKDNAPSAVNFMARIAAVYEPIFVTDKVSGLAFYTNGTDAPSADNLQERMRISAAGNVGVGTTTPFGLLALQANNGMTYPGNNLFVIGSSTAAATTTLFSISNTGNLSLSGTGNFTGGITSYASSTIGNGTQAGGLTINGGATTTGNAVINGSLTLSGGSSSLTAGGTITALSGITLGGNALFFGSFFANPYVHYTGSSLVFENGTIPTDFNGGNVGVGTSTPWAKLSVSANNGDTNSMLFAISSSTASATSTLFSVNNGGFVQIGTSTDGAILNVHGSDNPAYSAANLFEVDTNAANASTSAIMVDQYGNTHLGNTYWAANTMGLAWDNNLSATAFSTNAANLYFSTDGFGGSGDSIIFKPLGNGMVGIGTTSPSSLFAIQANSGATYPGNLLLDIASSTTSTTTTLFSVDNTGLASFGSSSGTGDAAMQFAGDTNAWTIGYKSSDKSFDIASSTSLTATAALSIAKNGNVTFTGSGGTCTINGSGSCTSDQRLKTNISPLAGSTTLADLSQLQGVTYNWADPTWEQSQNIGVIAQKVLAVFPQLVGTATTTFDGTPGTYYTVNYGGLAAPLITGLNQVNGVFNATQASTSAPTILSLFQGTSTPVTIDQFGDLGIGTSTASSTTNLELCLNGSCITSFPYATSTGTSTPSLAPDFVAALKQMIAGFLASATNGIHDIYANIFHANEVDTQMLCVTDSTGAKTCLTKSQLDALIAGAAGSASTTGTSTTSTTTAPILQINGNNPATVNIGATYNDLGATITGPTGDLNLGIQASVDGATSTPISAIHINTSVAGTHTIVYSATDQNGVTGSVVRTVVVVDPNATSTATSTGATSTSTSTSSTTSAATSTAPTTSTSTATTTATSSPSTTPTSTATSSPSTTSSTTTSSATSTTSTSTSTASTPTPTPTTSTSTSTSTTTTATSTSTTSASSTSTT